MKKNILILLAAACLLALLSCNDCRDVDCADGDFKFLFILSKADSSDLILSGQYILDSLTISPIIIDSTMPSGDISIQGFVNTLDYNVWVKANTNTAGYIIQLDSLPPDTLLVTVGQTEGDDCCPGITEFETLNLNGVEIPNDFTVCCINIFK